MLNTCNRPLVVQIPAVFNWLLADGMSKVMLRSGA